MKTQMSLIPLLLMAHTSVFTQSRQSGIPNQAQKVQGTPFAKTAEGATLQIKNGFQLEPGMVIYTGPNSSFEINFENGTVLEVTQLTVFKAQELLTKSKPGQSAANYKSRFQLKLGKISARVSNKAGITKDFAVQTPAGSASVRGTEKEVSYAPDAGMRVKTIHGRVLVLANNGIEKYINQGELTRANKMRTELLQAEFAREQVKDILSRDENGAQLEQTGIKEQAEDIQQQNYTKGRIEGIDNLNPLHYVSGDNIEVMRQNMIIVRAKYAPTLTKIEKEMDNIMKSIQHMSPDSQYATSEYAKLEKLNAEYGAIVAQGTREILAGTGVLNDMKRAITKILGQ